MSIRTAAPSHRATGLALFAERAWSRAYAALTEADRAGELTAKDQETLSSAAFLLGHDEEAIASLTRAHQTYASIGDFEASALAACRIGFRLMYREPARASGWLARSARTLEEAGRDDCVAHGFLSLIAGIRHAEEGEIDQALVVFHRILTKGTPMGRKRAAVSSMAAPLIRTKTKDLSLAGVERVSRVRGLKDGLPQLEDGRVLDVSNVVWSTGFNPGFSWIDLPVFDAAGAPIHHRGVVDATPGLYFVGLNFLYAMPSTMIHAAARDAEYVAKAVERRVRATASPGEVLAVG